MSENLLGSWKIVSWFQEDVQTHEQFHMFGERPNGYVVFAPKGRVSFILTGENRKPPQSSDDQAAAYRSMVAYSGKYRIEGDRMITTVDVSWDEARVGTEQTRVFRIEGDHLHIETVNPVRDPNLTGKMLSGFLVWKRET